VGLRACADRSVELGVEVVERCGLFAPCGRLAGSALLLEVPGVLEGLHGSAPFTVIPCVYAYCLLCE